MQYDPHIDVSDQLFSEWCQEISQADKFIDKPLPPDPEVISATQAINWEPNHKQKDMRPRIYDGISKSHLLLDSGAAVPVVPAGPDDVVQANLHLRTVNGQRVDCCGKKIIKIRLGRKTYEIQAVIAKISQPIIGWDFICKYRLNWEWDDWGNIHLVDRKAGIRRLMQHILVPHQSVPTCASFELVASGTVESNDFRHSVSPVANDLFELASIQALEEGQVKNTVSPEFQALLDKYPSILKPNFNEAKTKHKIVHRIQTIDDTPVYAKVRPLIPGSPKAEGGKKAWFELLKLGIIEKVNPNQKQIYTSALHLTPKKDGTQRPTGDYRALNAKTVVDRYPLPALRSFTGDIQGSSIFSRIDLQKSYHQIAIHEDDKFKTCVVTPWGTFQFKRLAMGLNNSAQCLQKLLDSILGDIPGLFIYLDDFLVFNKNKEDHIKTLEEIFKRLDEAGLSISLSKCLFGVKEIEFLGFKVNKNGITPLDSKVSSIAKCPEPTTQKELLRYLGMLNYYRHCYKPLPPDSPEDKARTPAEILQCLYTLATQKIDKKSSFKEIWQKQPKYSIAFQNSKKLLTNAALLRHPNPANPIALTTDASSFAVGGVLEEYVDGAWAPLAFWSKHLQPSQQKYSTYKRELLAIRLAIRNFLPLFYGRRLIIFTDHQSLCNTFQNQSLHLHSP